MSPCWPEHQLLIKIQNQNQSKSPISVPCSLHPLIFGAYGNPMMQVSAMVDKAMLVQNTTKVLSFVKFQENYSYGQVTACIRGKQISTVQNSKNYVSIMKKYYTAATAGNKHHNLFFS